MLGIGIAVAVTLAALLGGCGGGRLGPPASAQPLGSLLAALIGPPSIDPAAAPADASPPGPSDIPPGTSATHPPAFANHAAPDLEARLPAQIDQTILDTFSMSGEEFFSGERGASLEALLASLGKGADDLTYSGARDVSGALGGWVDAYRVVGADAAAVRDGTVDILRGRAEGKLTATQVILGNRSVTQVSFGADAPADMAGLPPMDLFVDGDTLFIVYGPEATAAKLLEAIK